MQVDPGQLQTGATQLLEKVRQYAAPGSPAEHVIQLLEAIEKDAMVAELQANLVNAVAFHLPDRLPGF